MEVQTTTKTEFKLKLNYSERERLVEEITKRGIDEDVAESIISDIIWQLEFLMGQGE